MAEPTQHGKGRTYLRLTSTVHSDILRLCRLLLPHLVTKRAQAERIIEFVEGRPLRYGPARPFTDRDFQLLEECHRSKQYSDHRAGEAPAAPRRLGVTVEAQTLFES